MSLRGLPLIFRMMRNRLRSSVSMGQTLITTALYFFLAYIASGVLALQNWNISMFRGWPGV